MYPSRRKTTPLIMISDESNTEILYDNLMNKFVWGNIKDPKVNIDHFHDNTIAVMKYRNTLLRLAEQLNARGRHGNTGYGDTIINEITDSTKIQEAIRVLDKSLEEIPLYQVPADFFLLNYISIYYAAGEQEKGNDLAWALALDNAQTLRYIGSLSPNRRKALENDEKKYAGVADARGHGQKKRGKCFLPKKFRTW